MSADILGTEELLSRCKSLPTLNHKLLRKSLLFGGSQAQSMSAVDDQWVVAIATSQSCNSKLLHTKISVDLERAMLETAVHHDESRRQLLQVIQPDL
jgi:hypothetical protein